MGGCWSSDTHDEMVQIGNGGVGGWLELELHRMEAVIVKERGGGYNEGQGGSKWLK